MTISTPSLIHATVEGSNRRLALALWSTCVPIGIALTLLGGPLITTSFGWRGLWLAGTCQVIVVAVLLALLLPRASLVQSALIRPSHAALKVMTLRTPVWFAVIGGCHMFLFSATALFPIMFVDRFGLSLRTASELVAPVIVTGLAGGLIVRWLSERGLAPWFSVAICAGVMAFTGVGVFTVGSPMAIVYGVCIMFAAFAGVLTAVAVEGAAASVSESGLIPISMGLLMQASNIGVFVGPIVFGTAIHAGGWTAGAVPLLACTGVLLLAAILLRSDALRSYRAKSARGQEGQSASWSDANNSPSVF